MDALRSDVLGVTRKSLKTRILDIVDDVQDDMPEYTIDLRFSNFKTIGYGGAHGLPTSKLSRKTVFDKGFHEKIRIQIGFRGVPNDVPDAMVAKSVFVTYHELYHVEQALAASKSDEWLDKLMSLQRLAVHNNRYLYDKNHGRLVSERDANLRACESTIAYMREEFPNVDEKALDEIIVQGIQLFRERGRLVVVHNPDTATPEKMVETFEKHLAGWSEKPPSIPLNYDKSDDELSRLFRSGVSGWRGIEYDIRHTDNGYDAYLKLAAIQCFLHPYMRAHYPNTYDIDMTPEHIFEGGFPETREDALKHVGRFYLEPYEMVERTPIVRDIVPRRGTILDRSDFVCKSGSSRNTSDLDSAVSDILARDVDDDFTLE